MGDSHSPSEWEKFLCFVLAQRARVPANIDPARQYHETSLRSLFRDRKGGPESVISEFLDSPAFPAQMALSNLARYSYLCDLRAVLVKPPFGEELVTSDSPIVHTNFAARWGEVKNNAVFEAAGLVVYYPLGPELGLLLYDPGCYEVSHDADEPIHMTIRDVEVLNCLQAQNAPSQLITRSMPKQRLEELVQCASGLQGQRSIVLADHIPVGSDLEGMKAAGANKKPFAKMKYIWQHTFFPIPRNLLSALKISPRPKKLSLPHERFDLRLSCRVDAANRFVELYSAGKAELFEFHKHWNYRPLSPR